MAESPDISDPDLTRPVTTDSTIPILDTAGTISPADVPDRSAAAALAVPLTEAVVTCELCDCIQCGEFSRVNQVITERKDGELDPDNRALYNIIKYYQNYLNTQSNTRNISKSDLWKMPSISQSEIRLQVLAVMRVLLKAGLDPNITVGTETPLMAAVRTHDESFTTLLLQHGADPNQSDGNEEMNAFALSVILNDAAVVEHLIHYGADINKPCCGNMTPLQLSMNKCVQISKLLLQSGADVQQVLDVSTPHHVQLTGSPLIQAVRSGNVYLASVLLEHGEDVNQVIGDKPDTALHIAVKLQDCRMVETLVQYGANMDKVNGCGHSPLSLSLLLGYREGNRIAKLLLESGCSRKTEAILSIFHRFYAPIFIACFMGRREIVDLLLQESITGDAVDRASTGHGSSGISVVKELPASEDLTGRESDIPLKYSRFKSNSHVAKSNPKSVLEWEASDGSSPLMMAALAGHYDIVTHLLDLGADPHIICSHGNLVHAAVISCNARSMDLLQLAVGFGCNINLINDQGNTPLHRAARIKRSDICLFLVEHGALLNVEDRFGETPLSASVYFGCEDNSRILIQHGADPDIVDTSGTTALYWSIFNNRESTLRLLLSAGARFTPEQFSKYPRNLKVMRNPELVAFIRDQVCQPRSLLSLCVFRIRKAIVLLSGGRSIKDYVQLLPVPDKVKVRLMLVSHDQPDVS